MKTNKYILSILTVFLSASMLWAQSYDEDRMKRDLKIAENILNTLSKGENSSLRFYSSIESNYIPDYGVIFSIPRSSIYVAKGTSISGGVTIYETTDTEAVVIADNGQSKKDEKGVDIEELEKEAEERVRDQITSFLIDYADLIGQLKPSDRILVQTRGRKEQYLWGNQLEENSGLTAQVLKSDLTAYKQGKMNRDQAIAKISWKDNDDKEVAKDVELFSTIFATLYSPDISTTYYTSSRRLGFATLDNFGVTFKMKVYSSSSDNGLHTIRTTGESGLTREQRDEKVNAMYPEFERSFLDNMLDYGRTLKSLNPNEMLLFKVDLTECKQCEMPEDLEISVKAKTLQDFDSGALSREKSERSDYCKAT